MSHLPPQQALHGLPIGDTFAAAYSSLFENIKELPKAAALPYLLSIALSLALAMTWQNEIGQNEIGQTEIVQSGSGQDGSGQGEAVGNLMPSGGSLIIYIVLQLLGFIPYVLFAVAWHRLVLFGPQRAKPSFFTPWLPRHTRMLTRLILLNVALALPVGIIISFYLPELAVVAAHMHDPTAIDEETAASIATLLLIILVYSLFALYVSLRLSFIFPAIAADETYGFADSWRHTNGQGLRLMVTFIAISVPFMVLIAIVDNVFGNFLVDLAVNYVLIAVWTGLFSTAFRHCTGWVPDVPASAPAPVSPSPFDE